jgi:cyclase
MMRGPAAALLLVLPAIGAVPDFRLQKIGNGVWAAIVNDEGLAGGNAGFVIGDDGVAVIDTFQDPLPAKAMLDEIRKLTPLPIRFVVNTHYHLDHVNGNDVFAAAGATIVAHPGVRVWMRTENVKMLDPPVTPEKKARVQSLTLPTVAYDSRIDLYLGSRRINVRYFPGHTGGRLRGLDPGCPRCVLRRYVVEGSRPQSDRRDYQGLG